MKDLRAATDFALMATKQAAQAVGKAMGFMIVLQRYLWLNLADLKVADHKVLLNTPVTPSGLFSDAVESITEHFVEAQKRAKAMSHVMPRRAFQQQTTRSRSSSAPGSSQWRDNPRPMAAVGMLLLLARSQMSGGKHGVPVGSAMATGGARDVTLARRWLLSGPERPSSQAPKAHMFKCFCVGCSFNKNAYILKRALSSSLSKYGAACPA